MLLERGSVIDARDVAEWTPLHLAAFHGRAGVAQLLLEHGADVNASTKLGKTPSQVASQMGHYEIVELLSAYVAKLVKQ